MNTLEAQFDSTVNQNSPIYDDYILKVKDTVDGSFIVSEKVDYRKIQESNGIVDDWSLDNLLKAGINPASLHVTTGYASRIDGISDLNAVVSDLDSIVSETPKIDE